MWVLGVRVAVTTNKIIDGRCSMTVWGSGALDLWADHSSVFSLWKPIES